MVAILLCAYVRGLLLLVISSGRLGSHQIFQTFIIGSFFEWHTIVSFAGCSFNTSHCLLRMSSCVWLIPTDASKEDMAVGEPGCRTGNAFYRVRCKPWELRGSAVNLLPVVKIPAGHDLGIGAMRLDFRTSG